MNRKRTFLWSNSGSFAPITAVAMTALVGVAGLATDYSMMLSQRNAMQEVADSAALAAVNEMNVANYQEESVRLVAKRYAHANFESDKVDITVRAEVDRTTNAVTVELVNYWKPFLLQYLGGEITPIVTSAKARIASDNKTAICMLALEPTEKAALNLARNSQVIANGCSVYSNSTHTDSILAVSGSTMVSASTCSSGGVAMWSNLAIVPEPTTDCPPLPDPLKDRKPPTYGGCDYTNTRFREKTVQLKPGVYCGGISIADEANITLEPGIYVIDGGVLSVSDTSALIGSRVGFYLTGGARVSFSAESRIQLEAPSTGELAGLLFFEDRGQGEPHRITSNNARLLTGTLYFPNGFIQIDSKRKIADLSAYTAIIARYIRVSDGPILHLNSNYGATDIPLPEGLLPNSSSSGRVMLVE